MYFEKRPSKRSPKGHTWAVKFYYTDNQGKRHRYSKSGFATKAAAMQHGEYMLVQKENNNDSLAAIPRLEEVWEQWRTLSADHLAPSTLRSYDQKWNDHLLPALGKERLDEITYPKLQELFNQLGENYSKSMANTIKAMLLNLFKLAIRSGYTGNNPVQYVVLKGKEKAADPEALTFEEFEAICDSIAHLQTNSERKRALITFMYIGYYTGLRRSEILALQKKDIDLDEGLLSVTKRVDASDGKPELSNRLKTLSSRAVIPLAGPLADYLIPVLDDLAEEDLLMSDKKGNCLHPNSVMISLQNAARQAGIAHFHPHLLRHTFITNIVRAGADPKSAAQLARHSDISTTLNIYTKLNRDDLRDLLSTVFSSASQKRLKL